MNVKNLLLVLAIAAMGMSCQTGSMTQTSATLKTADDTASFYIGYMYGTGLQSMNFTEPNMSAIVAGLNSATQKTEMETTPQEMEMFLQNYMQQMSVKVGEKNLAKGKKFLEENAKKAGVDTLSDGIQYKVEKTGDGAKPAVTDVVKVHYHGTLIDGTVFDSSVDRGEPAEFPLNQVIPGWTKSLQEMTVGSKWTIYIPSDQAYGPRGGRGMGPNETLIFDVELLEIVAPAEPAKK